MGVGGKSSIFQAGPNPWAVENFAKVAKYPSAQVLSQDIFSFGAIKSATDFQIYKEVGGLSGLDFAYLDRTAVYHTKNDALEFLRSGSLQHLGENMLAFLVHAGASYAPQETGDDPTVYFDVLGKYMVVYRLSFAELLHSSVIVQSLLVWCASLFMGGHRAVLSFLLSVVSLVLMWAFSIGFSLASALFIVPLISWAPVPYVANPWLAIGFFGSPSVVGAFLGQHMGYRLLIMCLSRHENGSETAKLEAERWLFKAGFLPWLVLLIFGTYYRIGSSYLALVWLVSPAFSYGLLEASLIPRRSLRPLKSGTLILGLALPVLVSAGVIVRLVGTLIGGVVRFDRNPGGVPECLPNVIIGTAVAVISCLTLVFALSYFHLSGAKGKMILASSLLFFVSVLASLSGIAPPFTPTVARPVNVVHVVDAGDGSAQPFSYISLFSNTPGKLTRERDAIDEGFVCGRDRVVDFVTFSAEYSCWRDVSASGGRDDDGWSRSDVPTMRVRGRTPTSAAVSIHTKQSTRWSLAVDMRQIEDFTIDEPMVSRGEKRQVDGWHLVQFSGGEKGPDAFNLTVFWSRSAAGAATLKLRTDFSRVTPPIHRLLPKLPPWCSFFGKSTSPFTFSFLTHLHLIR